MTATSPRIAEIHYLVELAKDWTVSCFASAQRSEFALAPHRFELTETGVRRRRVKPGSLEAVSPLDRLVDRARPDRLVPRHRRHAAGRLRLEDKCGRAGGGRDLGCGR